MYVGETLNSRRVRVIKDGALAGHGPVVYWMSRDQRAQDNWALLYAQRIAIERRKPLRVVFCLVSEFLGASRRQFGFMLRGLAETFKELAQKKIACTLLHGQPHEVLPQWLKEQQACLLVADFDPLIIKREWQDKLLTAIDFPCHEVDAHNIVPCWLASPKLEYAAYTLRPKIHKVLAEYLDDFPPVEVHPIADPLQAEHDAILFAELDRCLEKLSGDPFVAGVDWLLPGSRAGHACMDSFLQNKLNRYDTHSNDPSQDMQSNLSPYLHFGQLAPQRVALSVLAAESPTGATESFLEELIVRRELADNFCYYQAEYDQVRAFAPWAQKTLTEHLADVRDYCYELAEFEQALTHDPLWNAAQRQMVGTGKMHGYVRMYWAKKILEWAANPNEAMKMAIYLNDKYELDGRDPNGYAGIAWSIGGVHDRAWGERKVFGKIRYMNYNGMKRKFDVGQYMKRYL